MSPWVSFRAAALRDLEDKAESIQKDSPKSAQRFVRAIQKTSQLLLRFPKMGELYGQENPEFADIRWFNVSRFKRYLIFYREKEHGIEVIRILHSAQDIPNILGIR